MARQDYPGRVEWIIVDDGPAPILPGWLRPNWRRTIVRPRPFWREGENTQGRNLWAGLDVAEHLAHEGGYELRLTVVEDDDWYAPQWLSRIATALDHADLAGEAPARYYNVRSRRFSRLGNYAHTSLRCTGLARAAITAFRETLKVPQQLYDWALWRAFDGKKDLFAGELTVGIKGLPGPEGVGAGHEDSAGRPDPGCRILETWLGADSGLYEEFYMADTTMTRAMIAGDRIFYKTRRIGGENLEQRRRVKPGERFFPESEKHADMLLKMKAARYADEGGEKPSARKPRKPAPKFVPILSEEEPEVTREDPPPPAGQPAPVPAEADEDLPALFPPREETAV